MVATSRAALAKQVVCIVFALVAHAAVQAAEVTTTVSATFASGVSPLSDVAVATVFGAGINTVVSTSCCISPDIQSGTAATYSYSATDPVSFLMYGVITDQTNAAHLSFFTNVGAIAPGTTFGALFPAFNEVSILNDLILFADSNTSPLVRLTVARDLGRFSSGIFATAPRLFVTEPKIGISTPLSIVEFSAATVVGTATAAQIASVPEPSSWALMLGGLALIGVGRKFRVH